MTDKFEIDITNIDSIVALFETHDIFAHPSEVHGAITGLLCGGTSTTCREWVGPLSDFYHQGLDFPAEILTFIEHLFKHVAQSLRQDDVSFQLMIPDDDAPLSLRAVALAGWTQGFLLGFGCNKGVLADASDDVNEVVRDFAEICKMAADIDQSEEDESAFYEIFEYVRISAVMCFSELGENVNNGGDKITLH